MIALKIIQSDCIEVAITLWLGSHLRDFD
jgi:hypothetical protein